MRKHNCPASTLLKFIKQFPNCPRCDKTIEFKNFPSVYNNCYFINDYMCSCNKFKIIITRNYFSIWTHLDDCGNKIDFIFRGENFGRKSLWIGKPKNNNPTIYEWSPRQDSTFTSFINNHIKKVTKNEK